MEIIKVGIFLQDRDFAQAMARGLARECKKMNFYLLGNLDEKDAYDLILSTEPADDPKVVLLDHIPRNENIAGQPPFCLYKYRESQTLIHQLLFIYFKLTGKNIEHKGMAKSRLLIFASVTGGCGATSLSVAAAESLRILYGSRCLYVNLCPVNDAVRYLHFDESENLLKLFYYLDRDVDFPVESLITHTDNMDFFSTGLFNSYFGEMTPMRIEGFLERIEKLCVYDFVLLDIGNHFCRGNKELLGYADLAVLISREDMKLPGKYLERVTGEIERRVESGRLVSVVNYTGASWHQDESQDIIHISEDQDAFRERDDGLLEPVLTGNYGMEVSALARKIMEDINRDRNE